MLAVDYKINVIIQYICLYDLFLYLTICITDFSLSMTPLFLYNFLVYHTLWYGAV